MLTLANLKVGTKIEYKNEPWEILEAQHLKLGRGRALLRCKIKNLITGGVQGQTFREGDKLEEPELTQAKVQFMYKDKENYYFMDSITYEQFSLTQQQLGKTSQYLVKNTKVNILNYKGKPINVELPIKIDLKVTKAPPGVRGDTAQAGTKEVEVETGLKVNVPLFIKEGDIIKVDTRDESYVERVSGASSRVGGTSHST